MVHGAWCMVVFATWCMAVVVAAWWWWVYGGVNGRMLDWWVHWGVWLHGGGDGVECFDKVECFDGVECLAGLSGGLMAG